MEPSAPAKADPAQSICVDCGLCCNGSLFDWLRASPEEMKALPKADFISAGDAKGPGFQLACPLLEGTLCTAYGSRPGTCRKLTVSG